MEPFYNEDLGTMKATPLYQVSHYIRVNKHNDIKHWNQRNYLVISGILLYRGKTTKENKELGPAKLPVISSILLYRSKKQKKRAGTSKITCYIRYLVILRGKKQRNINSWDQQNDLVI